MRNDRPIILADLEAIFYRSSTDTPGKCDIALSLDFDRLINEVIGLLPENKEIHLVLFSKQSMTEEKITMHNKSYFLNDVIGFLKSKKFNNPIQVGCFLKTLSTTTFDFSDFSDFSAYQHNINFTETELKTELKQALVISDNHEILEKALNMAHKTVFISEKIVNPGELFLIHHHPVKNFIRKNCNSTHQVLLSIDFDNTLALRNYRENPAIIELIKQYTHLKNIAGFELKLIITTARSLGKEKILPNGCLFSIKNFMDKFHGILPLNYDDTIFLGYLPESLPEPVWGQAKAFALLERLINNSCLHIIHVDDAPEEKKFFDFLKEYAEGKRGLANVIAAIGGFSYPINSGEREKTIALFLSTPMEVMFDAINRLHFIQVCLEQPVHQSMIEYSHDIEEWTKPFTPLALQLSGRSSPGFFELPQEYEPVKLDGPKDTDQSCAASVLPVNK